MYWFNGWRNENFRYLLFLQSKNWTREKFKIFENYGKKITLTIDGEIVVFKSLAISKLIHLGLDTEIATSTINN